MFDVTTNSLCATITTDANGNYGFQKLNRMHKYKIIFTYDGMRFEDTTYTNNLTGGYSTAQEKEEDRNALNSTFSQINTSPQNYYKDGEWRKAYGLYSKIERGSGDYISYSNSGVNQGAFRYYDALEIFKEITTNKHIFNPTSSGTMNFTYYNVSNNNIIKEGYDSYESEFKSRLSRIGVSGEEINNIWKYINDTMITSSTIPYPELSHFALEDVDGLPSSGSIMGYPYLYTSGSDQSRRVDFGLKLRTNADLWLSKDIYKATILVNGKKQEYYYNKKKSDTDSQGSWTLNLSTGMYAFSGGTDSANRASNPDYVGESYGGTVYTREVLKSEYLYKGSDYETTDNKNLQVFVTYKIAVKNQSQDIWTSVDEIVDYYDSDQYTYDENSTIVKNNTFIGDGKGNRSRDLTVSEQSRYIGNYGSEGSYYARTYNVNGQYNYGSLYLTGLGNLHPGEITYTYITFKVNNDDYGKVKLDQKMDQLLGGGNVEDTVGKKNIAEINGYSTYYSNGQSAGVIDLDSNAGSLRPKDLDSNGDIISSTQASVNRLEDDTDKAGNLKLKIDMNSDETRSFSGYVFEDARTQLSDGAVIGNGKFNESDVDFEENRDKKINGVTIQLVELVQKVDEEGFATGSYEKEYVWSSITYGSSWNKNEDKSRYFSGSNQSKVILSGPGALSVSPVSLEEGEGEYRFDSLPPGDFFVRFIYGDTTQTVLTNGEENVDEVYNLLNNLGGGSLGSASGEGFLDSVGLNTKSYTGQDYKSTIYQLGVNQNSSVNYNSYLDKDGNVQKTGIVGYTNTETQNYDIQNQDSNPYTDEQLTDSDKDKMYSYSIAESSKAEDTVSDAKDVYSFREKEVKYSTGSSLSVLSDNQETLKNHRAEVLASATDLVTKASIDVQENKIDSAINYQVSALAELMENTAMAAQTGIIDLEIEYNRTSTQVYDSNSEQYVQNLGYHLQNLNLGLTERPRAQLNISKELSNIQVKLANGQILFDAGQSVSNLIYQDHVNYNENDYYSKVGGSGYRLRQSLSKVVKDRREELVQATMDEELMSGATIRLTYIISVNNIGEVDYMDKDFYYIGKSNNPTDINNVVRTNAMNVIDYVSNEINYEENYQEEKGIWKIVTTDILLNGSGKGIDEEDDDYVNSAYKDNLETFNVLITTNKLSDDLLPLALTGNIDDSRRETTLVLSTLLSNTTSNKNMIFTNLVELIESKNTFGRRMYLSKAGNQYVPYQSENKTEDESTYWIEPEEPDADSGQKVVVSVPTGANKNYNRIIIITISVLAIITGAVIVIKNKVLKNK